jgi:hypothetical protein
VAARRPRSRWPRRQATRAREAGAHGPAAPSISSAAIRAGAGERGAGFIDSHRGEQFDPLCGERVRQPITAFLVRRSHRFRNRLPRLARFAYQPGREPVPIDHLVSPLRYDILVRERYFALLRERRELAERDVGAFIELSRQQPYFAWFTQVVIPRFLPDIVGDDERVDTAFKRRVRASIELYAAMESTGYDSRRPIILLTGREIAPTSTGKHLAQRIYAGDGCHRLAWLRMTGVDVLEPDMYRLHVAQAFTPHDNTALLLNAMAISPPDYFSFLSLSYADTALHSEGALLDHVRSTDPARLREVRDVIAVDSPLLAAAAQPRT